MRISTSMPSALILLLVLAGCATGSSGIHSSASPRLLAAHRIAIIADVYVKPELSPSEVARVEAVVITATTESLHARGLAAAEFAADGPEIAAIKGLYDAVSREVWSGVAEHDPLARPYDAFDFSVGDVEPLLSRAGADLLLVVRVATQAGWKRDFVDYGLVDRDGRLLALVPYTEARLDVRNDGALPGHLRTASSVALARIAASTKEHR